MNENENSKNDFENENKAQIDHNDIELDKILMQLDLNESRENIIKQVNPNIANTNGPSYDLFWVSREFEDDFNIMSFGNVPDVKPHTITLIVKNHNNYEIKAKIFSKLSVKAEQLAKDGITEYPIATDASSDSIKAFVAACSLQKFEITRKNVFELNDLAVFFEVIKLKKVVDDYIDQRNLINEKRTETNIFKVDNDLKNIIQNDSHDTQNNFLQIMGISNTKENEVERLNKDKMEKQIIEEKEKRKEIKKIVKSFLQTWEFPIVLYKILENHSNILIIIGKKKKISVAALLSNFQDTNDQENSSDSYRLISEFYLSFLEKEEKESRQPFADLVSIKKYQDSEITLFKVDKNEDKELLHFYTNNYFIATYTFEQFKKLIELNSLISKLKLRKIFPPEKSQNKKENEEQQQNEIKKNNQSNIVEINEVKNENPENDSGYEEESKFEYDEEDKEDEDKSDDNDNKSDDDERISDDNERISDDNDNKSDDDERISDDNDNKSDDDERISDDNERISDDNDNKSDDDERISNDNDNKSDDDESTSYDNYNKSDDDD